MRWAAWASPLRSPTITALRVPKLASKSASMSPLSRTPGESRQRASCTNSESPRPESIVSSIKELRGGGSPISPGIARRILDRFRLALAPARAAAPPPSRTAASGALLTERETELLRLTAKGLSFETISELMGISPHTVVAHVRKIYRKLAVHSRGEAVYEATQLGLL